MHEVLDQENSISPLDLYHYLVWEKRCLAATPDEFQRLFELVARRLDSERFMRVRPYGKIGDRKMDGAFWADGVVFQVYSPDEVTQTKLTSKIETDLGGTHDELGKKLEEWVFVYNTRRGVPPDVPLNLHEYQREYPDVDISSMSEYDLWKRARDELEAQERAEILGTPPAGWDQHFGGDNGGDNQGRVVILHETQRPVDLNAATEALKPERPYGPPLRIQYSLDEMSWEEAATKQEKEIRQLMENVSDELARFAIFGLSHIPLLVHLGFVLTDRVDVRLFQYHRDEKSWAWGDAPEYSDFPIEASLLEDRTDEEVDVVVRVSLSEQVSPYDTQEVVDADSLDIDLQVQDPDVLWLGNPEQLTELQESFRRALKNIRRKAPRCRKIHLFYAGPAPGAVAVGRSINPTMNPPVVTYDYLHNRSPRYERAVTLSGL